MLEELQTGNKLIGFKQSVKAVENGKAVKLFLAENADQQMKSTAEKCCANKGIPVQYVPTMSELGKACGINIGAAAAVILRD